MDKEFSDFVYISDINLMKKKWLFENIRNNKGFKVHFGVDFFGFINASWISFNTGTKFL